MKEPWRQSSKWETMWQMLVTNQQINKLAASHMHFKSHGMLKGSCLSDTLHRLHTSPNLPTWTALLTVNMTGQKVHVDKGGSTDDSDTNNSDNGDNSNDNDGSVTIHMGHGLFSSRSHTFSTLTHISHAYDSSFSHLLHHDLLPPIVLLLYTVTLAWSYSNIPEF